MTAVPVRPAVSVIPLRDGPAGPEVFVQHRQPTMDFAAGAVVFPGGRCDPGDVAKGAALAVSDAILVDHVHRWRHLPVAQDRQADARTLLATGLRELAEETGLDLVGVALHYLASELYRGPSGRPVLTVTFAAELPGDAAVTVADAEHQSVGWWSADALAADPRRSPWVPGLVDRAGHLLDGLRTR